MADQADEISQWEFGRVCQLGGRERYAYAVNQIRKLGRIWLLESQDGGWCLSHDPENELSLAIWPAAAFALECATGEWRSAEPTSVSLQDFLTRVNDDVREDRTRLAVFRVEDQQIFVPFSHFAADVEGPRRHEYPRRPIDGAA